MRRRGISEAVSAILLLAVIATASYFALNGTTKRTIDEERTISDAIELKGSQIRELLSVISTNISASSISMEILNYGTSDIIVEQVFIDGTPQPFTIFDSDGNILNHTVSPRKIITLHINSAGQSIQILTGSKNIITLSVG
jgi:hypothetical protein